MVTRIKVNLKLHSQVDPCIMAHMGQWSLPTIEHEKRNKKA